MMARKKHSLLHAFIICSDHSSKKIKQMTINEKELKPSTRRVSLVEQELLTLSEQLSSPPVFSGVRVTRSLILYVCFVDHCLSLCTFSFGHWVVCSSSIYGFWLPLWYLQALFIEMHVQSQECNVIVSIDFISFYGFSSPFWKYSALYFLFLILLLAYEVVQSPHIGLVFNTT